MPEWILEMLTRHLGDTATSVILFSSNSLPCPSNLHECTIQYPSFIVLQLGLYLSWFNPVKIWWLKMKNKNEVKYASSNC